MRDPEILFEDQHLVVVNKPAGLLSQGEDKRNARDGNELRSAATAPNLVDWLRGHFGRNYVGLVHRLDRNTSGLMVVAKRSKSAQRLTQALQEGTLKRTYRAWVHGNLKSPARWEHRLLKDEKTNVVKVHPSGKIAVLQVRPVGNGKWESYPLTLAEFELETGRSHQIRAQAAHERHPLLGDVKYGKRDGFPRPALHSYQLSFPHPMSGEEMKFTSPLPDELSLDSHR